MRKWELNFNGNVIKVESRAFSEKLYVNGELQDEAMGISFEGRYRLWGVLPDGKSIKVSLGEVLRMHCKIFVDHKLVLSE